MKTIITISREFGAGGLEIGKKLSEILGIEYYDKDMIMRTALMDTRLNTEMVHRWENTAPSHLKSFYGLFDTYTKPLDEQIYQAQKKAILHMADTENCIIIGRNANYLLENYDHVLRIYCYAGENWRVDRMMNMTPGTTREEVTAQLRKIDQIRRKNCQHYTGRILGEPHGYDVCINTEKTGIDFAVKLILQCLEQMHIDQSM